MALSEIEHRFIYLADRTEPESILRGTAGTVRCDIDSKTGEADWFITNPENKTISLNTAEIIDLRDTLSQMIRATGMERQL